MMGIKRCLILAVVLPGFIVLLNLNARAENHSYYISPEGNDSWEGTSPDMPFATIQKARDIIRTINREEGTIIVYLREGEYRLSETFILGPEDSGTGSCPVIYTAMPGETPIITGDRSVGGGILFRLIKVEHITISGLTFSGYPSDRQPGISSLVSLEDVRLCSLRNNVIHDSQIPAIQICGENIEISGNSISGVEGGAIHIKGKRFTISDNFINDIHFTDEHKRPGWGICLDSTSSDIKIVNNIIARAGISLWMKGQNRNVSIRNNVFVNPALSLVKLSNPANKNHEQIRLTRNIFYYRNYDVDIFNIRGKRSLPEVSDSNVFWNPTGCIWTSEVIRGISPTTGFTDWLSHGFDTHSLVENPLFVNIENDNYALEAESVAFQIGFRDTNK